MISTVDKGDYPLLLEVWEASVRATHHFLKEEDLLYYKPLILDTYFDAVDLFAVKDNAECIIAFMGISQQKVEMLFIHPSQRGRGIGKMLLSYAISELNIHKVDVNEDNKQAVGFYKYMGFHAISRSEKDSMGKEYPILNMEL